MSLHSSILSSISFFSRLPFFLRMGSGPSRVLLPTASGSLEARGGRGSPTSPASPASETTAPVGHPPAAAVPEAAPVVLSDAAPRANNTRPTTPVFRRSPRPPVHLRAAPASTKKNNLKPVYADVSSDILG